MKGFQQVFIPYFPSFSNPCLSGVNFANPIENFCSRNRGALVGVPYLVVQFYFSEFEEINSLQYRT
jgi:hypothetical protein